MAANRLPNLGHNARRRRLGPPEDDHQPRSTGQRLVQALQQERLVVVGGPAGPGVRLGRALAELAGTIRFDVGLAAFRAALMACKTGSRRIRGRPARRVHLGKAGACWFDQSRMVASGYDLLH